MFAQPAYKSANPLKFPDNMALCFELRKRRDDLTVNCLRLVVTDVGWRPIDDGYWLVKAIDSWLRSQFVFCQL